MISIIIPTYNEEKYLPKLLKSIKVQTYRDYEVIVSDANSTDNTKKIALEFGAKVVKGGKPAKGRNNGAKAAQGEYLLFLDADVILPYNFLEKALKEFNHKYLELAPTCIQPISNKEIDKLIYKIHNKLLEYTSDVYPYTPGSSIFTTKRCHEKLSGFNEKMHLSEDHDYAKRARKFTKYGAITSTYVKVSMRRLDKEGRINLVKKYMKYGMYEQLDKLGIKVDIKKEIEYEFGKFNESKSLSNLENHLEKISKIINENLK